MNRLVLPVIGLCVVAFFGFRWWNGRDGRFEAHLTLGAGCSQSAETRRACHRLEAHSFQIVLNDGRGGTPILTADAQGNVSASIPPGDYEVGWTDGDMGMRTNEGTREIHVGAGQTVLAGTIHPVAGALYIAGDPAASVTQP